MWLGLQIDRDAGAGCFGEEAIAQIIIGEGSSGIAPRDLVSLRWNRKRLAPGSFAAAIRSRISSATSVRM
jgi:hypothetical protein